MGYAAKIRRCIRGCKQRVQYEDSVFAYTPHTISRNIMMTLSLPYNWIIHASDIATSCLHAPVLETLCAWAPSELYPDGRALWKLRNAVYGLRTAPLAWRHHVLSTINKVGFT